MTGCTLGEFDAFLPGFKYPSGIALWQDTGLLGHKPEGIIVKMPLVIILIHIMSNKLLFLFSTFFS
jgi:hypothetical protein